jgi:hypothetical protein
MKESFELLPGTYDESVSNQFPVIPKYSVYMNLTNRLFKSGYVSKYGLSKRLVPTGSKEIAAEAYKYVSFVFPDSSLTSSQKEKINSGSSDGRIWYQHAIILEDRNTQIIQAKKILDGKWHGKSTSAFADWVMVKGKQVLSDPANDAETITRNITGTYYEDAYIFLIEIDGPLIKL